MVFLTKVNHYKFMISSNLTNKIPHLWAVSPILKMTKYVQYPAFVGAEPCFGKHD